MPIMQSEARRVANSIYERKRRRENTNRTLFFAHCTHNLSERSSCGGGLPPPLSPLIEFDFLLLGDQSGDWGEKESGMRRRLLRWALLTCCTLYTVHTHTPDLKTLKRGRSRKEG